MKIINKRSLSLRRSIGVDQFNLGPAVESIKIADHRPNCITTHSSSLKFWHLTDLTSEHLRKSSPFYSEGKLLYYLKKWYWKPKNPSTKRIMEEFYRVSPDIWAELFSIDDQWTTPRNIHNPYIARAFEQVAEKQPQYAIITQPFEIEDGSTPHHTDAYFGAMLTHTGQRAGEKALSDVKFYV